MKRLDVTFLAALLAATIIGAALFVAGPAKLQPAYGPPTSCNNCAKDFAPGQEAENPGGAKDFAPGQEADRPGWDPNGAPKYAPGQVKQKDIP